MTFLAEVIMWSLMWCVCDWWLLSVISCLCQLRPAADSWAAAAVMMMMVMMVVVVVMCSRLWWGRWWDVMVSSQSRSLWCLSTAPSVHSSVSSCSSSSLTSLCQLSSPHRVHPHTHTPLHFTPALCVCVTSLCMCVWQEALFQQLQWPAFSCLSWSTKFTYLLIAVR